VRVLILAAGSPPEDGAEEPASRAGYPALLAELGGELLVERLARACADLSGARLAFVVREEEARRHHLGNVVAHVAPGAEVVRVRGDTAGAACSALLAIGQIATDEDLLVLNANEVLDIDFGAVVEGFRASGHDAGVVVFPSVHPRYSFVRLDAEGLVVEAAEKNPISRNATAGFYWYRRGGDFVRAIERMIRKEAHVDGRYYICPAFNELVLDGARIGAHRIPADRYRPVKSRRQLDIAEAGHLAEGGRS
jgi:hypothetical protein